MSVDPPRIGIVLSRPPPFHDARRAMDGFIALPGGQVDEVTQK
jgi:hypothetical protein